MLSEIADRTEKDYAETYGQQFGGRFGQSSEEIQKTLAPTPAAAPATGGAPIRYSDGVSTWTIPPEKEEAFLKSHPNAKRI